MDEEYIKEEGLDDNESSDAETISSTSKQISIEMRQKTCLTRLAHVKRRYLNITIDWTKSYPTWRMHNSQNYMGKIHIMPLVKTESGPVTKTYTEETTSEECN